MKYTKNLFFTILVLALTSLIFSYSYELKPDKKLKNETDYEYVGIIYKLNNSCKTTFLGEENITEEIKKALAENPKTSGLNLTISTVGARITISGKAETREQIKSAIQTSLNIPGVNEVISTIIVDPNIRIASKGSLL